MELGRLHTLLRIIVIYLSIYCFKELFAVIRFNRNENEDCGNTMFLYWNYVQSRSENIRKNILICRQACASKLSYHMAVPLLMRLVAGLSPWRPGFAPGKAMRDFWWTNWHWDRFFSEFFRFTRSISLHCGSSHSYITRGWTIGP
jgi:hypothetical protein